MRGDWGWKLEVGRRKLEGENRESRIENRESRIEGRGSRVEGGLKGNGEFSRQDAKTLRREEGGEGG
jgi:hypothetical protein